MRVAPGFFFEGVPNVGGDKRTNDANPMLNYITDFLATADGLALIKSFISISSPKARRAIVGLVEQITPEKK